MQRKTALVAVLCVGACGGGAGPSGPSAPVLSVGGDYTMVVEITENDCGTVTVLPLPTRVAHTAGATQFQLTHGPNTYAGSLEPGGRFTTQPRTFTDAASSQTVRIEGRFLAAGLEAVVTVDVQPTPPAASCRYLVRWTGTKVGAPNVIP